MAVHGRGRTSFIIALSFFSFFFIGIVLSQQQDAAPPGTVLLDNYAGSSDDDKLTNALADVVSSSSRSFIPAIMLSGRGYTFTKTRQAFSGLKIVGPPAGYFNSELVNGKYNSVKVTLNCGSGNSSWFVGSGAIYDVYISHIGFVSTNGLTQFWHHPLPGTLYACTFETLGFYGFKHVFGNPIAKTAITQINFIGQWTVVPALDVQFSIGGSDNELWTAGYLNIGPSSSVPGEGRYLMQFIDLGKTNVGPIYITANNGWAGILIAGDDTYGVGLSFTGCRFEGMNPSNPSNGALVVQTGGKVIYRDIWTAYGMADPMANKHSPPDQAMIMILGGESLWDGLTYDRAASVNQSVPLFYVAAGKVHIRNVFTGAKGGAWSGLPLVRAVSPAVVNLDDTVTKA
eukprot:TRINITY_DN14232_c0_g1_i2.p1 TRINITY_DN14232_c0_g1~~TRINITY_DN14232_c0_g1_i2.p1  ORF type:complete len:412 (+),score=72.65 TRINITY_DN14232_c0_g1_i2:38-1237(+)